MCGRGLDGSNSSLVLQNPQQWVSTYIKLAFCNLVCSTHFEVTIPVCLAIPVICYVNLLNTDQAEALISIIDASQVFVWYMVM